MHGCIDRMFTSLLDALFTNVFDACTRSWIGSCLWRGCIGD
jgi:hypothetical protein